MGRFTYRFFKVLFETVFTRKRDPSHDLLSSFLTLIWVYFIIFSFNHLAITIIDFSLVDDELGMLCFNYGIRDMKPLQMRNCRFTNIVTVNVTKRADRLRNNQN